MLTDKNFKLTSLKVNPLYKPVFDKLDALAKKEMDALDKSILWSQHYTKNEFKYNFVYPLIIFFCGVVFIITKGVKPRLYSNYIKKGRELEFSKSLGVDLDDIS